MLGVFRPDGVGRLVLTNRTMIGAFAARPLVLRTTDPRPLGPRRLPRHVRYHCATTPAGFVLTKCTWFACDALKTSLQRSRAGTPPWCRGGEPPIRLRAERRRAPALYFPRSPLKRATRPFMALG